MSPSYVDIDLADRRAVWESPEAEAFAGFLKALRRVQSAAAFAAPPADLTAALIGPLEELADHLEAHRAPEGRRLAGGAAQLGPGHPLLVPYEITGWGDRSLEGRVTFAPVHIGGNGAVHGGVIPLLFDDLLGIFVSVKGLPHSRTAYLHVNYRHVTPTGKPLALEAVVDRIEGRKTYVTGRLHDNGTILADAEALFVQLLPGQP
ncbi:PaaI family thioesterase [Streptomyces sp. NPDC001255]|uniref:PaaI family thioesterase n=1 Tax=Streptomyces sp. NPDC001255 TaxID=3364550 RepID=UPI0036B717FD